MGLKTVRNQIVGMGYYVQLLISYFPGNKLRKYLMKYLYGLKIDSSSLLYHGFEIRRPRSVYIGKNTVIGNKAILDGRYGLNIGDSINIETNAVPA